MQILSRLKKLAIEDRKVQALDTPDAYLAHREVFEKKPFLKELYRFYFEELLKEMGDISGKKIVEVGAGAYNLSDYDSRIIPSNSAKNRFIKVVADAQEFPFEENSLDGIVMINTFHHIPRPRLFFNDAARVLKKDGVLAMIEPFFSPLGRFVYKNLNHEPVLDTPKTWEIPPDHVSNQIMPYHIFVRDNEIFEKDYPEFKIVRVTPHTCVTHLLCGGVSYKCLFPRAMGKYIWKLEDMLTPVRKYLAISTTVVVRKAA